MHCQGSTSFTMSAMAGLLPEVDTVVTNAVSLHPVVPRFSTFKIGRISPLVGKVLPHVSPAWGDKPDGPCPVPSCCSSRPPTASATTRCAGW